MTIRQLFSTLKNLIKQSSLTLDAPVTIAPYNGLTMENTDKYEMYLTDDFIGQGVILSKDGQEINVVTIFPKQDMK